MLLAVYFFTWGLSLCVVYIPSKMLLEKTGFSFASGCQLEIASCLRMEIVWIPCSHHWTMSGLNMVCSCCHSLYGSICASVPVCLEDTISMVFSIPLALKIFSLPCPLSSPSPEGRGLMKTPTRTACSYSLSLPDKHLSLLQCHFFKGLEMREVTKRL